MLAAMMLPSTVPMVRLFARVSAAQPRAGRAQALFVAGYAAVWTQFGALAFAGDAVLHWIVDRVAWLDANQRLLSAAVLAGAGLFQFTDLKDRCLEQCRHPAAFLLPRYRRGLREAYHLGRAHGLFCLGCCWALMLVLFAVGTGDLRWMASLGALMMYEKIGRHGQLAARVAGAALLTAAAATVLFGRG